MMVGSVATIGHGKGELNQQMHSSLGCTLGMQRAETCLTSMQHQPRKIEAWTGKRAMLLCVEHTFEDMFWPGLSLPT